VLFSRAPAASRLGAIRPRLSRPGKLIAMDWSIAGGQVYDLWIDDIQFSGASRKQAFSPRSTEATEPESEREGLGSVPANPFFLSDLCVLCALCGEKELAIRHRRVRRCRGVYSRERLS